MNDREGVLRLKIDKPTHAGVLTADHVLLLLQHVRGCLPFQISRV